MNTCCYSEARIGTEVFRLHELQAAMDKVMAWFEGLNERGKIKAAQPLGGQGRIISGGNGNLVVDGPFAESKEAVGGYLVLQADDLNEAVEIARSMPTLKYGDQR